MEGANRESASSLLTSATLAAAADENSTWAAEMAALAGVGFALLDVADAIREQTSALDLGGIRDDIGELRYAVSKISGRD